MTRRCFAIGLACGVLAIQTQSPGQDGGFDRPLIFSVNPVGNGDFVAAPHTGSDFVRYQELVFQKCSEAGSRSARILASWREVEAEKGKWDWHSLDGELTMCEKYGIEPVVLICNIPAWVSPTGKPAFNHPPKEANAPDFIEFITRMAKRCKGRARYYEFWNEQNGCSWINEGCKNAHMAHTYLPWLQRCYKAIKAVDPNAQVAIGGLDDVGGWAPLFVEQCYKLRKEQYNNERFWDAIADHPYDKKPDDPIEVVIGKLDAIRAIARKHGDKDLALWITEYGWNARDMSLDAQTQGTIRFLKRFVQPDQADLVIAQQLALADFEPVHLGYGLCDLNLRPRPAFTEFQRLAREDVPTALEMNYNLLPDGNVRIHGKLMISNRPTEPDVELSIIDEQGTQLASDTIRPFEFSSVFSQLPKNIPLLAEFAPIPDGKRVHPVARLPLLVPEGILANPGFEGLFRAGVPWAWRPVGQSICRDGGTVGPEHVHGGKHSLMLMVFDNARTRSFDDRIQIPVKTKQGDRFAGRCFCRYSGKSEDDTYVMASMELVNPAARPGPRKPGQRVGKEWTELKDELTSPCNQAMLVIHIVSASMPKGHWLLALDDVSLTPISP